MAIEKNNIRIMVTISKDENEILKEMAKKENRSVSNLVATLIKNKIQEENQKNKED